LVTKIYFIKFLREDRKFNNSIQLRKQIMSIETDSAPIDQPKDFKTCNVFKLYSLIADNKSIEELKQNYQKGYVLFLMLFQIVHQYLLHQRYSKVLMLKQQGSSLF